MNSNTELQNITQVNNTTQQELVTEKNTEIQHPPKQERNSLTSNFVRRKSLGKIRTLLKTKTRVSFSQIYNEYSNNSMFFLNKTNKLRKFLIRLVEYKWFEWFMLMIIVINTLIMFLYTYAIHICADLIGDELATCLNENKSDIERDQIMDDVSIVFNVIFIFEMIIKILAKGFILHENSYLRSGWNAIDCAINLYSFIEMMIPSLEKLMIIRLVRLLRIFKSMQSFPGIRRLVASIILSLPTLGNVWLFLGFVFLVFATLGIQLFSGVFYNRCRAFPMIIPNSTTETGLPRYTAPPLLVTLCSPQGISSGFKCPENMYCVNFYSIPNFFNLTNVTIDQFDVNDEGLITNSYLNYGISNFDNIINCLVNVFTFMTYQNWSEILTIVLDGSSEVYCQIYFNAIVTIGGFFIMKLIFAAQSEALVKVWTEEIEHKKKLLEQFAKSKGNILEQEDINKLLKEVSEIGADELKINMKKLIGRSSTTSLLRVPGQARRSKPMLNNLVEELNKTIMKVNRSPTKQRSVALNIEKLEEKFKDKFKLPDINKFERSSNKNISKTISNQLNVFQFNKQAAFNTYTKKKETKYVPSSHILIEEDLVIEHTSTNFRMISSADKMIDHYLLPYFKENEEFIKLVEIFDSNINKSPSKGTDSFIRYLVMDEYSHTWHYFLFNLFIYWTTVVNIVFVCFISYPMSEDIAYSIQLVNILCSSIFFLEIIFKIKVLGFKNYFKDRINISDFVIVILGIIEIIYVRISPNPEGKFRLILDDINSSLSSIRALRFIRILRLTKKGSFIQRFVNFIVLSLVDLFYYCLLLIFFVFVLGISGRELFANKIKLIYTHDDYNYQFQGSISPRENFDTIYNAMLTVFILFIGDDWPDIMYKYARQKLTSAYLYFIFVIIIGNIMLFNLFLSIMMANYTSEYPTDIFGSRNSQLTSKIKKCQTYFKGLLTKLRDTYEKCITWNKQEEALSPPVMTRRREGIANHNLDSFLFGEKNSINTKSIINNESNIQLQLKFEKMRDKIPLEGKSLFILSTENNFRVWCSNLINSNLYYEYFIAFNILLSMVVLAIDTPRLIDVNSKIVIFTFDIITTAIFVIEIGIKTVAFGFYLNGPNSYLRYGYNFFDFGSVILSILYIVGTGGSLSLSEETYISSAHKIFKTIKILRLIRVIKLINLSKSLQAALAAFYTSLKQLVQIMLIGFIFILMFAVIGMTYFRGVFARCDFTNVPLHLMDQVKTKWDCLDYGGIWINPYPNFDNIKGSFVFLFEMMTADNWTNLMYLAVDAVGINKQPKYNNNIAWSLFFVVYVIFAYFFLLNLSIAILSDNFKKEKSKIENSQFSNPIQKEFYKIFKNLYKVTVPKTRTKDSKLTKFLLNILDSIYFDVVITTCIISNLIILMMNWPGMDSRTEGLVQYMNSIFNYIFIIEAVLKIYVFRWSYFKSGWNILDFIIVTETIVNSILSSAFDNISRIIDTSILRALRVGRILRLLKKAQTLNKIFNLFINSIPGIINIAILYFLLLFIYSIIGMSLFSSIKYQKIISPKWNFENFFNSLSILIRVTSGESWTVIMQECTRTRSGFYYCKYYDDMSDLEIATSSIACGSLWAFPYFMSFIIFSSMMFLEFFAVIIASAVNDTYVINLEELQKGQINKFKHKWATYDKEATGFIPMDKFQQFLFEIGFPLGISSKKVSDFTRVVSLLEIYTYENKKYLFFYDVLTELTKYYMLHKTVEDEIGDSKLFQNLEQVALEKSRYFETLNNDISTLKDLPIVAKLNPYYRNKRYKTFARDKISSSAKFTDSEYMRVHYAWAIKKLSKFTRCYKFMKIKCIKLIEQDVVSQDLENYAHLYLHYVTELEKFRNLIIMEAVESFKSSDDSHGNFSEISELEELNGDKDEEVKPKKTVNEDKKAVQNFFSFKNSETNRERAPIISSLQRKIFTNSSHSGTDSHRSYNNN